MKPGLDLVDADQRALQAGDVPRHPQNGALARGHAELGVTDRVVTVQPGEQQVPVAPTNQRDAAVLLRQNAAREQRQIGCDVLRFEGAATKLQQPADLGGIRQIGERT